MEFIASTLNSRELLGLLFICENQRKGTPITEAMFLDGRPAAWEEVLTIFADRLGNLSEALRFEVLEAHLMSVEDIDIYHNDTLKKLIDDNAPLLKKLTADLQNDPRFGANT